MLVNWRLAPIAAILVCALQQTVAGQASAPAKAWQTPRTPDGQPDIQGYWTEEAGGPEAVNIETGMQTADSLRVQGWTEARLAAPKPVSAIIDTPKTIRDVSSELLCIIGTPRLVFFADFQVVQVPGYVIMSWERSRDYRIIPLDNRPALPTQVKLHNGDSRGAEGEKALKSLLGVERN